MSCEIMPLPNRASCWLAQIQVRYHARMTQPAPPLAASKPYVLHEHGRTRTDDYFWLRERDNPDVFAYLSAENAYTEAMMAHTAALRATLFEEMRGRIQETDLDVPEQIDEYFYYSRTETGQQYAIHCRKRGTLDAPEEVLLDENALAQGHAYFRLGAYEVSPDHRWLAYSIDFDGDEVYTLCFLNLASGTLAQERISNTYYGAEWASDSRTIVYTTLDHAKRAYRAYRHTLGDDPAQDGLIYEEADEIFHLQVRKTADKRYILIGSNASDTSDVRYIDAHALERPWRLIELRQPNVEYSVDHVGQRWFINTNADRAINFKLMTAPTDTPARAQWQEAVPHRPDVYLEYVVLFKDYIARVERTGGLRRIRITGLDGQCERDITFPDPAYAVWPQRPEMFGTQTLRFTYQSPITPDQVIDYDLSNGTWRVRKTKQIPSGFDRACYVTERIEAAAPDGTRVPISVVYRRGARDGGPAPVMLYGYGAYGIVLDPGFDTRRLSLIDRGVIFAIAHVRGGAEMGRPWYDDGKLLHKKNTFTDFLACAEHLVTQGYTAPDKLAIRGGSAGGLLVGAATAMRPELFRAVIADVPFVDVVNTMFDLSIPLTAGELKEWGDPRDKTFYDYMLSYSPYDNIHARAYPSLLITAGLNDPRVQYWEPAKFAAKLRATGTGQNLLLLKTNMGAGHGGPSGRYDALHEEAFKQAYLLTQLGLA